MTDPKSPTKGSARTVLLVIGAIMVLAVITTLASRPPSPADPMAAEVAAAKATPQPAPQANIQGALEGVRMVRRDDESLLVGLTIKAAWNEQQLVDFAALDVEKIGKVIQTGGEPLSTGAKWVDVDFEVPLTDRLGNESMGHLITLTFPLEDLRAAKFENLSLERTLNLATAVRASSAGRSAVAAWCAEEAHSDGAEFCSRVL